MGDRSQDIRIEPGIASDLFRIHRVALAVAVRDRPELAHVGYDYFVAQFSELFADPDRMGSSLHRNPCSGHIGKPLPDSRGRRSKPSPINHFSIFVERAVMAPDVPKIDPDRHPSLGDAAWNFRDEVFRWLFHGDSLSDPRDRLIPFFGNFSHSLQPGPLPIFTLPCDFSPSSSNHRVQDQRSRQRRKKIVLPSPCHPTRQIKHFK